MKELPKDLREVLWGTPWGTVFPDKTNPPPLSFDGRTAALRILRRYFAALEFCRPGGRDERGNVLPAIPFKVDSKDILIGWPDYEKQMNFPSIVFLHGDATYESIGFTSYVEEDTRDKYGQGTVVSWQSEYTETFTIEIWADKKSELRALLNGIETSLSPTEQMYGLRFRMPEYFDQLVRFSIQNRRENDDSEDSRDRRSARINVEMVFHVVSLVNYVESQVPVVVVAVDVDEYGRKLEDGEFLTGNETKDTI